MDSNDPQTLVDIGKEIRSILDVHGFQATKNVLDEWNVDLFDRGLSKAGRAAFTTTSLIYMLRVPIDLQVFYGADPAFRTADGKPDGRTIQVLISNYQIADKYLGARPNGDVLHIPNVMDITLPPRRLLTYHDNCGYDLMIDVPAGRYQVLRYRISDTQNFIEVDQTAQSGTQLRLKSALPAPGIEFVRILAQ
jgi:hypothetical protein